MMRSDTGPYSVEVHDLVKRFGAFTAVDHISFKVRRGEVFGFLGPNGAGKSTTIRMLCGLLKPTGGRGHVEGLDVTTQSENIKEIIGYMSQRFSLYDDLTVEENIDFYSGIYTIPRERASERKAWVLEMAGLTERRQTLTRNLATGWKQRLALGCAIIHEPPVLFLDEPTSGVDPLSRRQFWDLIYTLSERGITVFVTTHYMDEAENCHRLALIHSGKLSAVGTPRELRRSIRDRSVLVLRGPGIFQWIEEMARLESLDEVAVFGDSLHIIVHESERADSEIRRFLGHHALSDFDLEQAEPSLEDVFVTLIKKQKDRVEGQP